MGNPVNYPLFQAIDSNGDPISGGKVYTYEPGTSTPKAAYTDSALTVPATNPIILDSKGESVFYFNGAYKINVLTSADVQVPNFPIDTVSSIGTAAGYDVGTGAGQVPLNSDLGTASTVDHGTASGNVPLNSDLGSASLVDTGTGAGNVPLNSQLPVPQGHIGGLGLTNAADTAHDITIAAGEATDSSDTTMLALASAMTKQIDATWAVGTAAGGLFTGSVAADTWYHVFLIEKDSDSTIDAGFDTSLTAANIPTGYTKYRIIMSVETDASANIKQIRQYGNQVVMVTPVIDVTTASTGTSSVTAAIKVPLGISCQAFFNMNYGATGYVYVRHPDVTDVAPAADTVPYPQYFAGANQYQAGVCWTDTSSQIKYRSNTDSSFRLSTVAYIHPRGQW